MSKAQFRQLTTGDVVSESQFYKVEAIVGIEAHLRTESGDLIALPKEYVEKFLISGTQFTETVKVNRSEMSHILLNSPRIAMQVCFNKQVKPEDVSAEAMKAYATSAPIEFEKKLKKAVKDGMAGVERVMVGRHEGSIDVNGRLSFLDMTLDPKVDPAQGRRLVDPRTLNWLVVNGKKYTIK